LYRTSAPQPLHSPPPILIGLSYYLSRRCRWRHLHKRLASRVSNTRSTSRSSSSGFRRHRSDESSKVRRQTKNRDKLGTIHIMGSMHTTGGAAMGGKRRNEMRARGWAKREGDCHRIVLRTRSTSSTTLVRSPADSSNGCCPRCPHFSHHPIDINGLRPPRGVLRPSLHHLQPICDAGGLVLFHTPTLGDRGSNSGRRIAKSYNYNCAGDFCG
jgi:hypothetical protein